MQSNDVHLDVDTMEIETGAIEKQASTSQYDQTHKLTSFEDICNVTRTELFSFFEKTHTQLHGKLSSDYDKEHTKCEKNAVIQRVPKILQRNKDFKKYYEPMELSVGPLHAANPYLFKAELKFKLAARYLQESDLLESHLLESDLNAIYKFQDIMENLQELKTSYHLEVIKSYNDENLARILLLDGCAVLQFIYSYENQSLNEFGINNDKAELIRQDLFLLENQIPFKVLQLLMGNENYMKKSLARFLRDNNLIELRGYNTIQNLFNLIDGYSDYSDRKPVLHLLDLLQSLLVMDSHGHERRSFWCYMLVCLPFFVSDAFERFAGYIVAYFDDNEYQQQSFRSVQELTAAGITLKPIVDSCNLKDIAFRKRWFFRCCIELPPLIVDSSTAHKMLNLVAYEMCSPEYKEKCYVTSYMNLIDLLIDDEKDVKLLRSADVLRNRLRTDTEVATLINKIGSTCCLSSSQDTYLNVKKQIEKHYKRKVVVWMAQVYDAHFSSPWSILALLAAVTVLLLTAIQTWYAIHPKK